MAPHGEPKPVVLTGGEKRIECPECNEVLFSDKPDALFEHKEKKIALGEGHLDCNICDEKLHSSEAWYYHLRMNHPTDQDLDCPACGEHYTKVHLLMDHLIQCDKAANAVARIDAAREQSLLFVRELNYRDEARLKSGVQLGPAPINSDFGEYLGLRDPRVDLTEEQKLVVEMHGLGLGSAVSVQKFHQGDSKGPDLLTSDTNALHKENSNPHAQQSAPVTKKLTTSQRLFPNAPPAVKPTPQQLAACYDTSRVPAQNLDDRNPNSRNFNVNKYYDAVMGRFTCAHAPHCFKTFKKAGQLINHLKTDDHMPPKYRCPFCSKMYKTLSALTQHCESPNTFCEIDYSYSYRIFLGQLTGGVVDVQGTHADHTPKYVITPVAKKMFGREGGILTDKYGNKAGNSQQLMHREVNIIDGPLASPTPEVLKAREQFQEMMQPEKKEAIYEDFVDSYDEEKKKAQQQRLAQDYNW